MNKKIKDLKKMNNRVEMLQNLGIVDEDFNLIKEDHQIDSRNQNMIDEEMITQL